MVFPRRQPAVEGRARGEKTHAGTDACGIGFRVEARDRGPAAGRPQERRQQAQVVVLPAPFAAEQP